MYMCNSKIFSPNSLTNESCAIQIKRIMFYGKYIESVCKCSYMGLLLFKFLSVQWYIAEAFVKTKSKLKILKNCEKKQKLKTNMQFYVYIVVKIYRKKFEVPWGRYTKIFN